MTRFSASLPLRFRMSLPDIVPFNDEQAEVVQRMRGLDLSVLLVGRPGSGKTLLACAYALYLTAEPAFISIAKYQHLLMETMTLRRAWETMKDQEAYDRWSLLSDGLEWLRFQPVLVIDDIGKEHTTATRFIEDEIDYLLRERYDRALTTILTSNLPIRQWASVYSPSMESFLLEAFDIIEMKAQDVRAARRA